MLLDTVRRTIEENHLLQKGDSVLCAVSGGADSICLLRVMQALREEYALSVYVANVNHMIRGEESDRDSNFVKSVCKAADVKCFYREYDVPSICKERKIGEEECGRIVRYEFFDEISKQLGGAKIATAHNLNDNAETVLFRLVRGSSTHGLGGIKYKRGNIIRPLLDVSRSEIEDYLNKRSITWCNDSTNTLTVYNRNKLRLCVMPTLNEISQGAEKRIAAAAGLLSQDDEFLTKLAEDIKSEFVFGDYLLADGIEKQPLPIRRRIAAAILKEWNAKEVTWDKIDKFLSFLAKESGKRFDINADYYAEKSYNKVYLRKRNTKECFSALLDSGQSCSDKNWILTARYASAPVKRKNNNIAVFDADKLTTPLCVRYRRDGDKIVPKGMNGTKKLSDIFSDEKIERHLRDSIPVVEKDGDILFVCGLRQSALYSANAATKNYLIIEFTNEKY